MKFVKEYWRCVACGMYGVPIIAHHCEGAAFKRKVDMVTVLLGPWFLLPLCQRCDDIVTHQSRRAFREKFGYQWFMWRNLIGEFPEKVPEEVFKGIVESGS